MYTTVAQILLKLNPGFFDKDHNVEKFIIRFNLSSFKKKPSKASNGCYYYKALIFDPFSIARYRIVYLFEDSRPKEFMEIQNKLKSEKYEIEGEYITIKKIIVEGLMSYIYTPPHHRRISSNGRVFEENILEIFVFKDEIPNLFEKCIKEYNINVKPYLAGKT